MRGYLLEVGLRRTGDTAPRDGFVQRGAIRVGCHKGGRHRFAQGNLILAVQRAGTLLEVGELTLYLVNIAVKSEYATSSRFSMGECRSWRHSDQ